MRTRLASVRLQSKLQKGGLQSITEFARQRREIYRLGLALFDLECPDKCLQRGDSWVFGPEAPYERGGDVNDVVFPCGQTIGADGDTINLYYGVADSSVALATGSIQYLLTWLDANSKSTQIANH